MKAIAHSGSRLQYGTAGRAAQRTGARAAQRAKCDIRVRNRSHFCAFLQQQMDAWDGERRKHFRLPDAQLLAQTPKIGGSTLAPPWATETVPNAALQALQAETEAYRLQMSGRENVRRCRLRLARPCPEGLSIFGIGKEKTPGNVNFFDGYRGILEPAIITVRAGERMPGNLILSPYDVRAFKYLFAVNRFGLHLLREMTPCIATLRGFPAHPQVVECAAGGGEAFFAAPDRVVINFGSGRFPPDDVRSVEAIARYVLACGLNEVTALFSDRDLSAQPYRLDERYGSNLPNKRFVRERPIDERVQGSDT